MKHYTEFEAKIRDEWVWCKAEAFSDENGIYKTKLLGVYIEEVNVTGLLTDYDIACLDSMIEPALIGDAQDRACSEFVPERDAHRLGD
jgi:hypothetical protein